MDEEPSKPGGGKAMGGGQKDTSFIIATGAIRRPGSRPPRQYVLRTWKKLLVLSKKHKL